MQCTTVATTTAALVAIAIAGCGSTQVKTVTAPASPTPTMSATTTAYPDWSSILDSWMKSLPSLRNFLNNGSYSPGIATVDSVQCVQTAGTEQYNCIIGYSVSGSEGQDGGYQLSASATCDSKSDCQYKTDPLATASQNGSASSSAPSDYAPATTSSTPASPQCNVGDCAAEAAKGGTLVECADGMYSNAGGLPGACSGHGGEASNASSPDDSTSTPTTDDTSSSQYADGQACGTAGNGETETYRASVHQCYWGTGTFHPQDYNPHDKSASQCPDMEIGTQSDCYVASHLAQDYARGGDGQSWTDTVTEGTDTIHFQCYNIGQDLSGSANPAILDCNSQTDPQDWVEWEFT